MQLEFAAGAGHWRVIDPGTGAFLTTVSNTPSDGNFWRQIQRAIERAGFSWEGKARKRIKKPSGEQVSHVDLEALAHAQAMARLHGGREPQIDDLQDKGFLAKVRQGFNEQETEEAIANMAQGVESARAHRVVSRLLYTVEQHGTEMANRARERNPKIRDGGVTHELLFVANDVARKRGLRYWKTPDSAYNTMTNLLTGTSKGMAVWVANLLEATMDEIDGLRWDTGPTKPAEAVEPAAEPVASAPSETLPPVISIDEAKNLIMAVLSSEWTLRNDMHEALVPEHMSNSRFEDSLKTLIKEGLIERERERKRQGSTLYRLSGAAMEPMPEPTPEPEPSQQDQAAEAPEFDPFPGPSLRQAIAGDTIAERYAGVLLSGLEKFMANGAEDWRHVEPILARLDKLAGIGVGKEE